MAPQFVENVLNVTFLTEPGSEGRDDTLTVSAPRARQGEAGQEGCFLGAITVFTIRHVRTLTDKPFGVNIRETRAGHRGRRDRKWERPKRSSRRCNGFWRPAAHHSSR